MFSPEKQTLFADLSKKFWHFLYQNERFMWAFSLCIWMEFQAAALCGSCFMLSRKHSPASLLHYMLSIIVRHYWENKNSTPVSN